MHKELWIQSICLSLGVFAPPMLLIFKYTFSESSHSLIITLATNLKFRRLPIFQLAPLAVLLYLIVIVNLTIPLIAKALCRY